MTEKEIIQKCIVRNWAYNNFTAYLIETHMSVYQISNMFGMHKATLCYWLHHKELSAPVNAFFFTMRKLLMVHGIRLDDLF